MNRFFCKILRIYIASVLLCTLMCCAAAAAEGDVYTEIYYARSASARPELVGTAFFRSDAFWVPADSLRTMGVPLVNGEDDKTFYIDVKNPSRAFDCAALNQLAGREIRLAFPALTEDGVSYFNMIGMQNLTKLNFKRDRDAIVFTPNKSNKSYVRSSIPRPSRKRGKFTMVWEHVAKENPNLNAESTIPGLDVISPTWFNLADENGGMANRASFAYTEAAHRKGYFVWGLVSNGFSASKTSAFFSNKNAADIFAARILIYAKMYGLDGVNIDFEGMKETDRARYVLFFSKLSKTLRAEGLTVSVDVFIPADTRSSRSHDRAALARYADYIMLMAYDEHWRTSPTAGSVASLPWVTKAVEGTLAEGVPASKLVLGVPFYMRRWEETRTGKNVKVKSYTLTMEQAEEVSARRNAPMQWLESIGQHYFTYMLNGKRQMVWVEDAESIKRKLELVNKHNLAGMAAWRKGHEKPEVWNVISSMMGK